MPKTQFSPRLRRGIFLRDRCPPALRPPPEPNEHDSCFYRICKFAFIRVHSRLNQILFLLVTLPRYSPDAPRLAAVEEMVKCCAKKPSFYEGCWQTLHHGTPGASIFQL